MEYGKIIAVTGLPGLFELLSSKNDGAIVRSLEDKSTKFVSSRIHNFSHLETIEVFTVRDNVNLIEVFHAMEKDGSSVPDEKDAAALKKYFQTVYPDLDFEKVYVSDLKKMIKWFGILKKNEVEIKLSEPEEAAEETEEPASGQSAAAAAEAQTGGTRKAEEESSGAATPGTDAKASPKKGKKAKAADEEDLPVEKTATPDKAEKKKTAEAKKEDPAKKAAPKKSGESEKANAGEAEKEPAKKATPKKAAPKKK